MSSPKVQRALISVSDKSNLKEFAIGLARLGVELYSTGGTRSFLEEAGLSVQDVSEYTQFPEMMDGRLKTLHPKIFGGILGRLDVEQDRQSMEAHSIQSFELVVVNLYPFAATISQPDVTEDQAIEKIDIGGPSLVRAAAKNHRFVTIATSPAQYASILESLQESGCTSLSQRKELMAAAFAHTAEYDRVIAGYFATDSSADQPATLQLDQSAPQQIATTKLCDLRYGENPHQAAALFGWGTSSERPSGTLVGAKQLNGKELSYNNYLDLDAAWSIVRLLPDAGASVIKHNNPCGAASSKELAKAAQAAMEGDSVSAFGSVLAFNRTVDLATAKYLATPGLFIEAIVAPSFEAAAVEVLTTEPKWKKNVRLLELGELAAEAATVELRCIDGGLLVQQRDLEPDPESDWNVVTESEVSAALMDELRFGWAVCRFVKSNAITVSRDRTLRGAGAGQMSRVDSVAIALRKAEDYCQGAVLASDAFFPFPDSIEHAAKAGIAGLIQPGGSKNDQAVIDACNQHGLPMVFTGRRHFKH